MQGLTPQIERSDHGNVRIRQFRAECVFLEDRRVAPASRPVELRDDRRGVLDADLVDAVLVTVQCLEPAIALEAETLHRRENVVGLKVCVYEC